MLMLVKVNGPLFGDNVQLIAILHFDIICDCNSHYDIILQKSGTTRVTMISTKANIFPNIQWYFYNIFALWYSGSISVELG
jgi:hypothetical protein